MMAYLYSLQFLSWNKIRISLAFKTLCVFLLYETAKVGILKITVTQLVEI